MPNYLQTNADKKKEDNLTNQESKAHTVKNSESENQI